MYARHCAIDLLKIHKSYGKAMVLAQEGLRWANDYNEECYWNRVIRELNLYESYIDDLGSLASIMSILKVVETNNDTDSIGDNGTSYGILQIQRSVLNDVNRIYGTDYQHKDMF